MINPLYVVRHGIRADDQPSPTNTYGDPSLTEEGAKQAEEVADKLIAEIPATQNISVYCSPFYRCLQTATAFCSRKNLPIHVDYGIGESYVTHRPEKPGPLNTEQMSKYFNLIDLEYKPSLPENPLGESRQELRTRLAPTFDHIMAHAESKNSDVVVLFTHAAIKIDLGQVLVGYPSQPAATCSMDKYTHTEESNTHSSNWVRELDNDVSHLSKGAVNIWKFAQPDPAHLSEDNVTHLVSLDTSQLPPGAVSEDIQDGDIELEDLETEQPIVRIKSDIFEGRWQKLVGTEMFLDSHGAPLGTAKYCIALLPTEMANVKKVKLQDRIAEIGK